MAVRDARARGWGWPGKVGSTQEQAFRRDHIVTITAGGVRLAVHRDAAPLFQGFCDEIVARGYPLDKVADDWGFANRSVRGYPDDDNPAHKSNHAWGLAVDLNATTNPMTSDGKTHTDMPAWVIECAASWGLSWGGNYVGSRRDPMHFEVLGTPDDVARAVAAHKQAYPEAQQTVKVKPMHDPWSIENIVADCPCPTGGAWVLTRDGAVYTFGGAPYKGGCNQGNPISPNTAAAFAGREAATIEPGEGGYAYVVTATTGERYGLPETK